MKETMRKVKGIYGAENSAHHFFREFSYCDSGMIPWLIVAQIMSKKGIGTQVSVCFPKEVCRQVNSEKMEMEEEV